MKKLLVLMAGLLFLGVATPMHQAQAGVSVGVSFGSGRHGGLSLSFSSRPDFVVIPGSRVYYGSNLDCDVYEYGDRWYYVDDGGDWYWGPSYEGPFTSIAFTSVPYAVRSVPISYRRHWGHSGWADRSGYHRYRDYRYNAPQVRYRDRSTTPQVRYRDNRYPEYYYRNHPRTDQTTTWRDRRDSNTDRNQNTWSNRRGQGRWNRDAQQHQQQQNQQQNGNGRGHDRGNRGRHHGN